MRKLLVTSVMMGWAACAVAAPGLVSSDQPIEISSDTLDVYQNEHKAIFSGNVIATQGTTNMRAAKMTVYYRGDGDKTAPAKKPESEAGAPAVSRIDAEGAVVFTTPTETAKGDSGVYNVETDTIDLMGGNVTLTRDKNILKGTHLTYNMKTGRSVLTSGNGQVSATGQKTGGRVRGLFVPSSDKPAAGQ